MIEAKGTNGRVTFDGVLVTIHRGGARAWLRGTGIRSIPARAVAAVELKPAGLGRGWIRFATEGDDAGDLDEVDDEDLDGEYLDDDDLDGEDGGGAGRALGLGGRLGRSRRAGGFDPARDPNTVLFARSRQRSFEDVRREVKTAMWEAGRRTAAGGDDRDDTPTQPLLPHDPVRELRQLGQLLRDGLVSRAEFERAKARLLDRI